MYKINNFLGIKQIGVLFKNLMIMSNMIDHKYKVCANYNVVIWGEENIKLFFQLTFRFITSNFKKKSISLGLL